MVESDFVSGETGPVNVWTRLAEWRPHTVVGTLHLHSLDPNPQICIETYFSCTNGPSIKIYMYGNAKRWDICRSGNTLFKKVTLLE